MHLLGNIDKNAKTLSFVSLSFQEKGIVTFNSQKETLKKMQNFIRRKNVFGDQASQFMICRNLTPVFYTYAKHSSTGSPIFQE